MEELFVKAPVKRVYFKLALPVVLGMITTMIYNFCTRGARCCSNCRYRSCWLTEPPLLRKREGGGRARRSAHCDSTVTQAGWGVALPSRQTARTSKRYLPFSGGVKANDQFTLQSGSVCGVANEVQVRPLSHENCRAAMAAPKSWAYPSIVTGWPAVLCTVPIIARCFR